MIFDVFILLILFQIKHFLADYPLQGSFMLKKFRADWGFLLPLTAHAGVHALFTLAICWMWEPALWWLAIVDFVIHFVMDRLKAGPKYLGRYKALSGAEYMRTIEDEHWAKLNANEEGIKEVQTLRRNNVLFWWSLGLDQMVHHLTHYYIIFALMAYNGLL